VALSAALARSPYAKSGQGRLTADTAALVSRAVGRVLINKAVLLLQSLYVQLADLHGGMQ
jgi:hypothetical protein